jgi:aryl carrier-like protein
MKENGITRVFFTPALIKLFKPSDFPTLEILLVGGEPVLPELIATWAPILKLVEAIGMTEGVAIQTNIGSGGKITRHNQTLSGVPWIVDPHDFNKLAPIGALGELMVEGPCLARGHLHDEEKTNAAFIEAPEWARKAEYPERKFRLHRTGDMARYYLDGIVRLLGRRDTRVKLNGQRIELGEVESHMQKNLSPSTAVAADVVTVSQAGKKRSFLVGFIFATTEIGKPNDPEDGLLSKVECGDIVLLLPKLKEEMALALPAYMVPTVFLPFTRRPTNTSGKMDRKRLRQIASELSTEELMVYNQEDNEKILPVTENEKLLASLWGTLFKVNADSFGVDDNFIMYGGDSLQAIKLVRLAQDLGILLSTSEILQNPTLKNMSLTARPLAEGLVQLAVKEDAGPALSAEVIARVQGLVCSYKIEEVTRATDWQSWAVYTGLLKTRGWADFLTFDLKGDLDVARLEAACKSVLTQFPVLRTVFVVDQRRVFQVVLEDHPFQFETREATSSENAKAISKEIFDADAASICTLGEPIVRFSLMNGSDEHRLRMRISHAQYDAMSLAALFPALKRAYSNVELY